MTESTDHRRSDARRNREAILAAALEALATSPDASLNAIARRAGVANATLYRHFPTREDLVLATYQQEVRKIVDAAGPLLRRQPPIDALRSWLEQLAGYAMTKQGMPCARPAVPDAICPPPRPTPRSSRPSTACCRRTSPRAPCARTSTPRT
jgi:AcrR family transcriptional regulator